MNLRTRLAASVAVGVVLALAACTGEGTAPSQTTDAAAGLPEGVTVRVYQPRSDYAARIVDLSVTNGGSKALTVTGAEFTSPHFGGRAMFTGEVLLRPGLTRDLRVQLGDPVCSGELGAPATLTVEWRMPDGRTADATVSSPDDDTGAIDRIAAEDCLGEAIDSVLTVTPADILRIEGIGAASVAWIDLALTPTGAPRSVTIDSVGSTILLDSPSGGGWPVATVIDGTGPQQTVSLDLRPARCDPHAIAEDKVGTVFPFAITTSAGPSGTWKLTVGNALRSQIYGWVAAYCGY